MGIIGKILGRDNEKKADKAAEKGSKLPGPVGDVARTIGLGRKGEEKAEKEIKDRDK